MPKLLEVAFAEFKILKFFRGELPDPPKKHNYVRVSTVTIASTVDTIKVGIRVKDTYAVTVIAFFSQQKSGNHVAVPHLL